MGLMVLGLLIFATYLYTISDIEPPEIKDRSILQVERTQSDSLHFQIRANFLQQNSFGLYEMYLEGADFER